MNESLDNLERHTTFNWTMGYAWCEMKSLFQEKRRPCVGGRMLETNPIIEWWQLPKTSCLRFTFQGYLSEVDAQRAVDEWRLSFRVRSDEQITIVWDCLQMKGYSREARNIWTKAMIEMKHQIASVWLITNSSIVKMGASVISLFSSINIHTVKTEQEILRAHAPELFNTSPGYQTDLDTKK